MTRLKFLLRTLTHFRLNNLAVIAGAAIASAILTGAMMVGDSVKVSLRNLTLQRLGPVDYSLAPGRFFNEDLAARIQNHNDFAANPSPASISAAARPANPPTRPRPACKSPPSATIRSQWPTTDAF